MSDDRHRKMLEEKSTDLVADQFIKVQPVPAQVIAAQPSTVLHYCDIRLSVPAGTEPVWIAELMKALA